MSWLAFAGLGLLCLTAAIGAWLAAVWIWSVIQTGLGAGPPGLGASLDRWFAAGNLPPSLRGQLDERLINSTVMGAVAVVLGIDHWRRKGRAPRGTARAFRWRLLALGLGLGAACWAPAVVGLDLLARQQPGVVGVQWSPNLADTWLLYSVLTLAAVTVGATAEEVIFRGALPARLGDLGPSPLVAVLVASVGFIAVHESVDPVRILQLGIGALALAWSVYRLGGLEFAIGSHIAWNLAIGVWGTRSFELVTGTPVGGLSTSEWTVLLVMAATPGALAELTVRLAPRLALR